MLTREQLVEKVAAILPDSVTWVREALSLALARGLLFTMGPKKGPLYATRPASALFAEVVPRVLGERVLSLRQLSQGVRAQLGGLDGEFKRWLPGAIERSEVCRHPPGPRSNAARFGTSPPDARIVLKELLVAAKKASRLLKDYRLGADTSLALVAEALGIAPPATSVDQERIMAAIRSLSAQRPAGTLLPVREVRQRAGCDDKARFDRAMLALTAAEIIALHHHDHPSGLSEADRTDLVQDERGTHYVGVALRGST